MTQTSCRLTAAALSLSLLVLSACSGGGVKATAPAMGRWVECELSLPPKLTNAVGLHGGADGVLELIAYLEPVNDGASYSMPLKYYRSTDGGGTWAEESAGWLDSFNAAPLTSMVQAAAWDAEGVPYLIFQGFDGTPPRLGRMEDGALRVYDKELPLSENGSAVRSFRVAENGDLVLDYLTQLIQVDPESGGVQNVYTVPNGNGTWNDGWAVWGDVLAVSEPERIVWYDLNTGKETRSLPCQGIPGAFSGYLYRVMDFTPDGALTFADAKGIFHAATGSDTLERLADGALSSLSTPTVSLMGMAILPDRHLLLCRTGMSVQLIAYTFDPDIPTVPGRTLTVWSLFDDALVRQAAAFLQKSDPDVYVDYQVGYSADSAVTVDDARRALATQITAGKCPDVLVLDSLPIESYIEKGVLSDLTTQLKALTDSGALLANIAGAYRQPDGKIYAVPTCFQVPVLHGSDEAMDAIRDLPSMADWLESTQGDYLTPLLSSGVDHILATLYPAYADGLKGPDGAPDEARLRDFLTQVRRITSLRTNIDTLDLSVDFAPLFDVGPLGWLEGYNALTAGSLVQFQGLYAAWTASDERGAGRTDTLFGCNGFSPVTSLGVSAQSAQQDLCRAFVETALSDEVQGANVGKGLPVSSAAFDSSTQRPDDGMDFYLYFGTTVYDAEGAQRPTEMKVLYPPAEYRAQWADRIKALDHPLLYDTQILRFISEGAQSYLNGTGDLESAIDAVMQKIKLYQAE